MPWKETCAMDERMRFIVACRDGLEPIAELCRRFGISRKTGYKWLDRYEHLGPGGLVTRRSGVTRQPAATAAELVDLIIEARKEHASWGPKKLRAILMEAQSGVQWPAASTIGEVLQRHGLIRPRRRRGHAPPQAGILDPCTSPNDVWCTDFKGHFALGDGTRCHPLTLTDAASRYLLKCEALSAPTTQQVWPHFERAFREFGVPCKMRSDNGPPFASTGIGGLTALSVWWIRLGITPERIEPAKPQQNGRHERMHRTLKAEATQPPERTLADQQRVFDRFRHEYNDVRPHEALGQTPPARHYQPSLRPFPSELLTPEYVDMPVRWVNGPGRMSWRGHSLFVTKLLAGQPVGLRQVSETRWEVVYGPVSLGFLDERDREPRLAPPRTARRSDARDAIAVESVDTPGAAVEMPSLGTSQKPLAPSDLDNAARCPHPHSPDDENGSAEEKA